MQLSNDIQIVVFEINNTKFESIGEVNLFETLIWPEEYIGYATVKMTAPINQENSRLFKEGNFLWNGGKTAAKIEIVKSTINDKGQPTFEIQGRTLECLLDTRIIWGTFSTNSNYVSDIMRSIVANNCSTQAELNRRIPYLYLSSTNQQLGGKVSYQQTGGSVYDSVFELAQSIGLGFTIDFKPNEKRLEFRVFQGINRTINQNINLPIVFSNETDDILTSSYYVNIESEKNIAFIQGEDSGEQRKSTTYPADISGYSGFERKELYVDARDLQSESQDEQGNSTTVSEEEYIAMLQQRGNEKLGENSKAQNFECQLRVVGSQYEYDKDFFLGDIITVIDTNLGISINVQITAAENDYSDEHQLVFTFGYGQPNLLQKLRAKLS